MKKKEILPEEKLLNLIKKSSNIDENTDTIVKEPLKLQLFFKSLQIYFSKKNISYLSFLFLIAIFLFVSLPYIKKINVNYLEKVIFHDFSNLNFIKNLKQTSKPVNKNHTPINTQDVLKEQNIIKENITPPPQNNIPLKESVNPNPNVISKFITPPQYLLLAGIIDGTVPSAIIENRKTNQTFTVEKGSACMGYTVSKIEKGQVTFSNDNESFILQL